MDRRNAEMRISIVKLVELTLLMLIEYSEGCAAKGAGGAAKGAGCAAKGAGCAAKGAGGVLGVSPVIVA